jgi:SEC-C motif-containing protein
MKKPKPAPAPDACPCGTGKPYDDCCAIHHGGMPAPTAEALMRSRYTAFVRRLEAYLYATWHPTTRPNGLRLLNENPPPKWLGLDVKATTLDGDNATVEFVAKYRLGGASVVRMHETSRFVREGGRWFYVDGKHH